MEPRYFSTQAEFRLWLEEHHQTAKELLVGFYKTGSGRASMTWPQSVDHALCFGWIDGVRRSIDDERYSIRFTPRKATSIWSAVNIKKMDDLQQAGLMTAAGLAAFALRTEAKSKIYSHESEPAVLAPELDELFRTNEQAWAFFCTQAPSYRKAAIHWVTSAKQHKTTLSRITLLITDCAAGRRLKHMSYFGKKGE